MLNIENLQNKFYMFKESYEKEKFLVYIYGAGRGAKGSINLLRANNIEIEYIIDRDLSKSGSRYLDIPIISLDEFLKNRPREEFKILIASPKYEKEISQDLLNYMSNDKIECFECELYYLFISNIEEYKKYLLENKKSLEYLNDILEDDCSKKTLKNVIMGRLTGNLDYFRSVYTPKQYFCDEIIRLKENEVIIDCGAYDGDTLRDISRYTKNLYNKIYCMEPDKRNLIELKKTIMDLNLHDICIIDKGAWNETDKLCFSMECSNESSKIIKESDQIDLKKIDTIDVVAIDDVINESISFIKMDIEGAEIKALKGAQNTIKKYKPKLAISVYHRNEDLIEIPNYIKKLVPTYNIYIRHHGINGTDTVLYAIDETDKI